MAYVIIQQSGITNGYLYSFNADTRADISNLPVPPECKSGSDCLVIEDGSVWILNSKGIWKELGEG